MTNRPHAPRSRSSLRLGGALVIALGVLGWAAPSVAQASDRAPQARPAATSSVTATAQALQERRRAASRAAVDAMSHALGHSAAQAGKVRHHMEMLMTWGYGFEQLSRLDASVFETPEPEVEPDPEPDTRRFAYSNDSDDPLAGL